MKQLLVLVMAMLLVVGGAIVVSAQEDPTPVGIDEICGDDALTINVVDATLDADQVAALETLLRGAVTTAPVGDSIVASVFHPAPGAILLVETPAGRYYATIGVADVETCEPLAPDARMEVGSNTKMMTAAIIYQLQEEGVLSTADLVSEWLPEEIALFPDGDQITIDMLLTHTSGLFDYLDESDPDGLGFRLEQDPAAFALVFSPQELIQLAAAAGVQNFAPGEAGQWSYTNTGYIMLGLIIEAATEQPLVDVFSERIFEPLGMEDTYLGVGVPDDDRMPQAYLDTPFDYNTRGWSFTQAWAAGATVSTAEDMAVFVRALFSGELFQDEATLVAMLEPASPGYIGHTEDFYYGHGMNYKDGFMGHGGQTPGFESDLGYNPDLDATLVLLTNSANNIAGQGVYFVGEALGWTDMQTFIDPLFALQMQQMEEDGDAAPEVEDLAVPDIVGLELAVTQLYDTAAGEMIPIEDGENYRLTLGEDGQLAIQADCNTVTGTYVVGDEDALSIELGVTTLVACGPDSFDQTYLSLLANTTSVVVSVEDADVTLILVSEDGLLYFGGTR